jgi:hypothetical protein
MCWNFVVAIARISLVAGPRFFYGRGGLLGRRSVFVFALVATAAAAAAAAAVVAAIAALWHGVAGSDVTWWELEQ